MTKVKICGLKRLEDIEYVNLLRPDYVGFVFAPSSRQVTRDYAKKLTEALDSDIKKVGVFLNHPVEEVREIVRTCSLDIIQLHGDENVAYCCQLQLPVWKVFRIKDSNSFKALGEYRVNGYLLDTYHKTQYGGTGEAFDWQLASHFINFNQDKTIILAGGLNSENVRKAVKRVSPAIVDVSSGVEEKRYKSFDKIKKFIEEVKKV